MADLEFEHSSTVQEMSETILAIEENEDTVLIEEEKKTLDGLVLKELPCDYLFGFGCEDDKDQNRMSVCSKLLAILPNTIQSSATVPKT